MKKFIASWIAPIVLALVGVIFLYMWVNRDTASELSERLPAQIGAEGKEVQPSGPIRGELVKFDVGAKTVLRRIVTGIDKHASRRKVKIVDPIPLKSNKITAVVEILFGSCWVAGFDID